MQGNWFTWTSKVHGTGVLRHLDQIHLNDDWLSVWPNLLVNVLLGYFRLFNYFVLC